MKIATPFCGETCGCKRSKSRHERSAAVASDEQEGYGGRKQVSHNSPALNIVKFKVFSFRVSRFQSSDEDSIRIGA